MKVAVITADNPEEFEINLNDFIDKLEKNSMVIKDIKFTFGTSGNAAIGEANDVWTAYIIHN